MEEKSPIAEKKLKMMFVLHRYIMGRIKSLVDKGELNTPKRIAYWSVTEYRVRMTIARLVHIARQDEAV
jgi:hypothetical protein